MPPELVGPAFLLIKASHHAVGIHRHLGVPQSSSLAGKAFQRGGGSALRGARDGQHYIAAFLQCSLQKQIVSGVVPVFLAEDHIHADGARLALGDALQHGGVQCTPPGPAAYAVDTVIVDGHDDNIGRGRTLVQPGRGVLNNAVETCQLPRAAEPPGHAEQESAEQQPAQAQVLQAAFAQVGSFNHMGDSVTST